MTVVAYQPLRAGNGVQRIGPVVSAQRNGTVVGEVETTRSLDDLLSGFDLCALLPNLKWVVGPYRRMEVTVRWMFGDASMACGVLDDGTSRVPFQINRRRHELFSGRDWPAIVPRLPGGYGYEVELSVHAIHRDLVLTRAVALALVEQLHAAEQPLWPSASPLLVDNIFSHDRLGWPENLPLLAGQGTRLALPQPQAA